MTVLTWGNSEGELGRCDAKCHEAVNPICHCICGGRYHGVALQPGGLREAMQEYEEEIVDAAKKQASELGYTVKAKSLAELLGGQQPLYGHHI